MDLSVRVWETVRQMLCVWVCVCAWVDVCVHELVCMCWRVCVPAWPVCLGEHFLQLTGSKGLKHVLEAPFLVVIIPQAVCGTINNFFTQNQKIRPKCSQQRSGERKNLVFLVVFYRRMHAYLLIFISLLTKTDGYRQKGDFYDYSWCWWGFFLTPDVKLIICDRTSCQQLASGSW